MSAVQTQEDITVSTRIVMVLLLGILSIFFAEVFSGSSPLWFTDPFSLLVTLPLYLIHTLFFLNLALHSRKYSLAQLFLWGALYGLYESWITKVLWTGYPGSEPIFGRILGIAVFEFSVLVFFFHNIFAFILPLLVFEIIARSWSSSDRIHSKILKQVGVDIEDPRKLKLGLIFLAGFAIGALSNNTGYDIVISTTAVLGSVVMIWLLDKLVYIRIPPDRPVTLEDLKLGKRGMMILAGLMGLLYISLFILIQPDKRPHIVLPYIAIMVIYLVIIYILRRSSITRPVKRVRHHALVELVSRERVYLGILTVQLGVIIASLIPPISLILLVLTQFSVVLLAPVLFAYAARRSQV